MASDDANSLLSASLGGNREATDRLMQLVYAELRELAARHLRHERVNHTLQPTALVNEAFMKMVDQKRVDWQNTAHFRAVASNMMRRILVDHARGHRAEKRGGELARVGLSYAQLSEGDDPVEVVTLNDLLTQLASLHPRHAQVVEWRVFGGLTMPEIAEAAGCSLATVKNDWRAARAWLLTQLDPTASSDSAASRGEPLP